MRDCMGLRDVEKRKRRVIRNYLINHTLDEIWKKFMSGAVVLAVHRHHRGRDMSGGVTLSGGRVWLRPWHDQDRAPFAAMNADTRVMAFFRSCLSRAESDTMVDHIQAHFNKHRFGFWAIAVPGVAPFIGFT